MFKIDFCFQVFRNINTAVDSATQISTIPVDQNPGLLFDYNLLAKKIIASEEFQRALINQLNISQSDFVKLHDQEFHQLFKSQLQEMNSENLNWINVNTFIHIIIIIQIFNFF